MTLGGTVYGLGGERDENDCYGMDTGAIAVLDLQGMEISTRIQVNPAGNFYTERALPDTYKVKLISQGREITMDTPINGKMNGGDCNYCHSAADFMGAKGRIVPARP